MSKKQSPTPKPMKALSPGMAPKQPVVTPSTFQSAPTLLQLQPLIGNQAVTKLATGGAVVQRMSVTVRSLGQSGQIDKVDVNGRPGTGASYGQGSHTTAWVTFVDTIRNTVERLDFNEAAAQLRQLYNEYQNLPGAAIQNPSYLYSAAQADIAVKAAEDSPDKTTIQTAIEGLLTMRNHMPLSHNASGDRNFKNEDWHAHLMTMERTLWRDEDVTAHRYYDNRFEIYWQMFDYEPTTSIKNEVILSTISQHLKSMELAYPSMASEGYFDRAEAIKYYKANCWDKLTGKMKNPSKDYPDVAQKKSDLNDEIDKLAK